MSQRPLSAIKGTVGSTSKPELLKQSSKTFKLKTTQEVVPKEIQKLRSVEGFEHFNIPDIIPDLLFIMETKGEEFLKELMAKKEYRKNPQLLIFDSSLQDSNKKRYEDEIQFRTRRPKIISTNAVCKRCKEKAVEEVEAQLRRGDEGMTTISFCTLCGMKWMHH